MKSLRHTLLGLVLLCPAMGTALANDFACKDAAWASDHPAVPRHANACLMGSSHQEFDVFEFQMGNVIRTPDGKDFITEQAETIEGAHTRLLYAIAPGTSPLALLRSYAKALEERDYKILYQCSERECAQVGGGTILLRILGYPDKRPITTPSSREATRLNQAFSANNTQHLLVAESADKRTRISIFIGLNRMAASQVTDIHNATLALIDVVESGELDVRMVDAEAMNTALTETGRIALENIYFETASARLTAESDPALREMARLLAENAGLNVYIVGHTDNIGSVESNLTLSRNRAAAVVMALETRFGVVAGQAVAAGVASYAPLASNATEAGRAANRRVELVLR